MLLKQSALPKLPLEIKKLINEGSWCLYSLKDAIPAPYVLKDNNDQLWALNSEGSMTGAHVHFSTNLELDVLVRFE